MPTGTLVAVGTAAFESKVLRAASTGGLHVVRRCVDVADLLAIAATRQATVALVSQFLNGLDTEVVNRVRDEGVAVVGVIETLESDGATHLHRLGVDRLVTVSELDSLADVVADHTREPAHRASRAADRGAGADRAEPDDSPNGRVIAIWGPAGAPGRSVLSLGLADALARSDISTLLVDADVYGGSQGQWLGLLDESSGLLAAARAANRGRLDRDQLAEHARSVSPGLRILTGLPRADRWVELGPVLLRRVLDIARSLVSVTVVDCGFSIELDEEVSYDVAAPRRNGATLSAIEQADVVVVVGAADPVGLGRLLRGLADLHVQAPQITPYVVVNRMRPSLGWSADEVAAMVRRTTQLEVRAFLPDDPATCDRALVQGKTLVECASGSRLTKAIGRLASMLERETAGVRT